MAAYDVVSTVKVPRRISERTEQEIDLRKATLDRQLKYGQDNGYDIAENRNPDPPIKEWMAYFNMIRTSLGAGLVATPLAVSQAGIILGPLLIIFIGGLFLHTHILLLNSLQEVSRQLRTPIVSYRYGFRVALLRGPPCCHTLGNNGPCIIGILMILSQIGICTVFVIFTSDNLRDIADWPSSKYSLFVLFIPYVILMILMRNLRIISYISIFGTFIFTIGALISLYYIFEEPHGEVVHLSTTPLNMLFSNGIILFLMNSIAVALVLDKALKDPTIMIMLPNGVIPVGLACTVAISVIFGSLGYWSFGTMEENMLRSLPYDENLVMFTMFLYLIGVALAYPLQCYPAVSIIIEFIKYHDLDFMPTAETLEFLGTLIRPFFVFVTFAISYYIPFQGPFVAFVGNLCTSALSLIGPALMDICLRYPHDFGYRNWRLFKNLFIIMWGLVSFIFGVMLSSYLIYIRLKGLRSTNET